MDLINHASNESELKRLILYLNEKKKAYEYYIKDLEKTIQFEAQLHKERCDKQDEKLEQLEKQKEQNQDEVGKETKKFVKKKTKEIKNQFIQMHQNRELNQQVVKPP